MDLNEKIAALRDEYVADVVGSVDDIAGALESPIERAFLWAFVGRRGAPLYSGEMPASYFGAYPGARGDALQITYPASPYSPETDLWVQAPVEANGSKYRLDFALVLAENDRRVFVDVELDGHDFHERTKQQAARDKKRDRDLQSIGWRVARFTGSEVYRDPYRVVDDAFLFAIGLLGPDRRGG